MFSSPNCEVQREVVHSFCFHGRPKGFWALVADQTGPPEDGIFLVVIHFLCPGQAGMAQYFLLGSSGEWRAACLPGSGAVPARVEAWETGMGKRVDMSTNCERACCHLDWGTSQQKEVTF